MTTNATPAPAHTYVLPYLYFLGRTVEAMEFYKQAVGAEIQDVLNFDQSPMAADGTLPPGLVGKVMHASFKVGDTVLYASDGGCDERTEMKFDGFSLTLHTKTREEAHNAYKALTAEGKVNVPINESFFAEAFGMLQDKFGVHWTILYIGNRCEG